MRSNDAKAASVPTLKESRHFPLTPLNSFAQIDTLEYLDLRQKTYIRTIRRGFPNGLEPSATNKNQFPTREQNVFLVYYHPLKILT